MSIPDIIIDDDRQEIIDSQSHLLITGGPGSGKTTISLAKAKAFIDQHLTPGQRVLFLSFSNAAIRQLTEKSKQSFDSDTLDKVEIKTYHSFAWEVLKSYSFFLYDNSPLRLVPPHEEAVIKNASTEKSKQHSEVQKELFDKEGRICFDLFAAKALELFSRCKSLLNKFSRSYPLIIVDEFQDSDDHQWELIKLFSKKSQIICSADPNQRIYEWRNASAKRLNEVIDFLDPLEFDFKGQNNRSPNRTIAAFGNQVLNDQSKTWDDNVKLEKFYAVRVASFGKMLNATIVKSARDVKEKGATYPFSIAILGRSNALVRTICKELESSKRSYSVFIDENPIIQAGRVISNFMEQSSTESRVISDLRFVANHHLSRSGITSQNKGRKINEWADILKKGGKKKTKCITAINGIRQKLDETSLSGDPIKDWIFIRDLLENSDSSELHSVVEYSKHLKILQRGAQIVDSFSRLWKSNNSYSGAVSSFDLAISQEQIIQSQIEPTGILVMTMHKSKGKEFDATIVIDHAFQGTFIARDKHPFKESRRLLNVAVTRSRYLTTILMDPSNPSPLI